MKKYKLFSAFNRCTPCKMLVNSLNSSMPDWKNYIEYIDADNMTENQLTIAKKLNIMGLPSFTDEDKIIFRGYDNVVIKKIIAMCKEK